MWVVPHACLIPRASRRPQGRRRRGPIREFGAVTPSVWWQHGGSAMADTATQLPGPRPRRIPPGHVSLGIEPKHLCVGLCYRPYSQWHSPECYDGGRAGASEVRAWNDSNTGWSHTLTTTKQPSTATRALCTCRRDRYCCGQKGGPEPRESGNAVRLVAKVGNCTATEFIFGFPSRKYHV